MSGQVVPYLGGPMDGLEAHRAFSTSRRCVRTFWCDGNATVHEYIARGVGTPYVYEGVRDRREGDSPFPLPLHHINRQGDA